MKYLVRLRGVNKMEEHTLYVELGPYCAFVADECGDEFFGFSLNIGYSKLTGNFQMFLQLGGLSMGFVFGPAEE